MLGCDETQSQIHHHRPPPIQLGLLRPSNPTLPAFFHRPVNYASPILVHNAIFTSMSCQAIDSSHSHKESQVRKIRSRFGNSFLIFIRRPCPQKRIEIKRVKLGVLDYKEKRLSDPFVQFVVARRKPVAPFDIRLFQV